MRQDLFLSKRLDSIWEKYFSDVKKNPKPRINFGRNAIYRFGSIKYYYDGRYIQITINGRFRDEKYPQQIIDHTIAHELVHYAQGFPTPGPALHRFPHRGGVIDKELRSRGLNHLVEFYNSWVPSYLQSL